MGDIHGWLLSDGCIYLAAARWMRRNVYLAPVFVEYVTKAYIPIFFANVFFRGMAFDVIRV